MVPAGNKALRLSSVNRTTKIIHHSPYLFLDPSSSSMSDYKRLPSKDDEDDSLPAEGF